MFADEFPAAAAHLEGEMTTLWQSPTDKEKGVVTIASISDALGRLVQLVAQHATRVQSCRARDAQKGCSVISDYGAVNAVAVDVTSDAVVREALERAQDVDRIVTQLVRGVT